MSELENLKAAAEDVKKAISLTYYPIALKFIKDESEIPSNAIRPFKDTGKKWAVCQLIQKARTEQSVYCMTLEDHWCWYPIISYGYRKLEKGNLDYEITLNNLGIPQKDREEKFLEKLPVMEYKSNYALLIGSINVVDYVPDLILMYCDDAQKLRRLIGAIKYMDGDMLPTELDYVNSCCWSVLPTYKTRKFRVTIPDPGEIERAEMKDSEMILSVPTERFTELCAITVLKEQRFALRPGIHTGLVPYFPRPQFIDNLYGIWGLETGREISWTEEQRGY